MKKLVKLAGIPRSTYYFYVKQMDKPNLDADLKKEIQTIYDEHEGRYGYRRIRDELASCGQKVNHKKVQRIMKELGLKCVVRMKKYKSYKGTDGEIITYTIGDRPTYSLVSAMWKKALERLPEEHQLLMHSDQGWHYQMKQYRHALESRGIVQSMSRKGNCYDNSVTGNFFGIMKSEFLYLKEFESVEQFKIELEKYMEYYNTKRMKAKLKMSPVQ